VRSADEAIGRAARASALCCCARVRAAAAVTVARPRQGFSFRCARRRCRRSGSTQHQCASQCPRAGVHPCRTVPHRRGPPSVAAVTTSARLWIDGWHSVGFAAKGLLRVRATATAAMARRCSSRCTWRAARWMRRASSTQPAATCSCSCSCILGPCGRSSHPAGTRLFVPYICQHRRGRALVASIQARAPLCSGWAANSYTASHVYACTVPPQSVVFGVGRESG
jgi:hypothetical protein